MIRTHTTRRDNGDIHTSAGLRDTSADVWNMAEYYGPVPTGHERRERDSRCAACYLGGSHSVAYHDGCIDDHEHGRYWGDPIGH